MPVGWSITHIWVKPSGIPQIWVNPQIWVITQIWGNHAQIAQNWVLHLFLGVVIYLVKYSNIFYSTIMNCYLYMIANYVNDTYKHKYYVVNAWAIISGFWFHWNLSSSLKFEGKSQLSLKFEWRTQIWVTNSNLSETVWYPPDLSEPSNLSDHP